MSNPVPRFRRRNGNGKNPDSQGVRVEIFCEAKNTTRPLTVWIVGTDIERGLLPAGRCAILRSADQLTNRDWTGEIMGKQINYWMGYEDFLQVAQAALDSGCIIIKPVYGRLMYGQTLDFVTEDEHCYWFYVPEAGKLLGQLLPLEVETVRTDSAVGNAVVEAGFSWKHDLTKEITRSRIFAVAGRYDDRGEFVPRPECVTKLYNKLVRIVKKVAPLTELTDTYISTRDDSYLQEAEWTHKEYICSQYLQLKLSHGYKLK